MLNTKLEQQQIDAFARVNTRLGLPPDTVTHGEITLTKAKGEPIIFSSDPVESDYPGKMILVNSIQELKKMIGRPNTENDEHIRYPEPLPESIAHLLSTAKDREDLFIGMDEKMREDFNLAKSAYVLGNSDKVKDYEAFINAAIFPTEIVLFASLQPLHVYPNTVIKKPTLAVLNYSTIIYEEGGTLTIEAAVSVNAHKVTPDKQGNVTIKASPDDIPAIKKQPKAKNGLKDKTLNGTDGTDFQKSGHTGKNCPWYCRVTQTGGEKGHKGGNGAPGQPGLNGTNMSDITFNVVGDVTGKLLITAGGQNGQVGQAGGDGGDGGPGGTKGTADPHGKCTPDSKTYKDGAVGQGGNGGIGGKGGNGGDGANLIINITGKLTGGFDVLKSGANAGNGGQSGTGGTGIPLGNSPKPGDNGTKNGSAANITINGKSVGPS